MQKLKATIHYIDSLGRIVLTTENNEAILIYDTPINGHRTGDEVTITPKREDDRRAIREWEIVEENHV